MTGTYEWYIEGIYITNVVYKTLQMRTAKQLPLATGKTVRGSNPGRGIILQILQERTDRI